jgi:curved DNA-binding protein CbpA
MATYYELLKIQPSASPAEINTAIEDQYNQWRRLVTHHDPNVVTQANQTLQILETIRSTLMDSTKRSVYDAAIGVNGQQLGGLGDPNALLRMGSAVQTTPPRPVPRTSALPAQSMEATNAWVCTNCNTANPIKTKFCSKCGAQLGVDCPNCGKLTKATDKFCAECGKNLEESKAKADENSEVMLWINQTKAAAAQMKYLPTIQSVIARGSFPDIYKACFESVSSWSCMYLLTKLSIKHIKTNPKDGEIIGKCNSGTLKLMIQNNSLDVRGVVLVYSKDYPYLMVKSFVPISIVQSLKKRQGLFSEIKP